MYDVLYIIYMNIIYNYILFVYLNSRVYQT